MGSIHAKEHMCDKKTLSFKYMYLLFYLASMLLRGSEVASWLEIFSNLPEVLKVHS